MYCGLHHTPLIAPDDGTLIHIAVVETAVAGKYQRTAHHCLVVMILHYFGLKVEFQCHFIAPLPHTVQAEITAPVQHFLLLPVDKGLRPVYLRRDAQGEFKAFVPLRFHSDAYLSVYGITGLYFQGHCIFPARLHRSFHRHIEIEEYTVFFCRHRHLRNQGESPGTIGVAAVDVHAALLLTRLSASFQRTVLGNLSSVVFHRGEQGIVHRPFKLLDVERIARVAPQTAAELHVGERHASLHRMTSS